MTCSKTPLKFIKPHPLKSSVTSFFVIKIQVVCKDSEENKPNNYADGFDSAIGQIDDKCEH